MLDVARPETRAVPRSQADRFKWGIVDALLGLVMLPFGLGLIAIEGIVRVTAWLFAFDSRRISSSEAQ